MSIDSHYTISNKIHVPAEDFEFAEETIFEDERTEDITLQGENFERFGELKFIEEEDAKRLAAEEKANLRPIEYRYIEQMKKEGVTEELAVKAFIGRFGGNEVRTKFFLNSDFYYGSDAPTPLDRLKKAIIEDKTLECIEMLEGTKISLDYGDHF